MKNILKYYCASNLDTALASVDCQFKEKMIQANLSREDAKYVSSPSMADVIVLFENYSFRDQDHISRLFHDCFIRKYCQKIYVINWDDIGRPLLPGLYVSLEPQHDRYYFRPCVYPKIYNQEMHSPRDLRRPEDRCDYLYSFVGNVDSHPVRQRIADLQHHENAHIEFPAINFHHHSSEQERYFVDICLRSKFVLCPRGASPSTYRLFETMSLGRCPVIISDDWQEPEGIVWRDFTIRIDEKRVRELPVLLERESVNFKRLGDKARKVWIEKYRDHKKYYGYLTDIIHLYKQHMELRNAGGLDWKATESRMRSSRFMGANGWLLRQRLHRRIKSRLYN